MGLYSSAFVASQRRTLAQLKNVHGLAPSQFKGKAFEAEDSLFHECQRVEGGSCALVRHGSWRDASGAWSCYSKALGRDICMCNALKVEPAPRAIYGAGSAKRQVVSYPCVGLTKFKANYGQAGGPFTAGNATKYVLHP